jgi:hypothetical protein
LLIRIFTSLNRAGPNSNHTDGQWRHILGTNYDTYQIAAHFFLQHLKLEAEIIRDDGNQLRAFLDEYAPKIVYHDEILQNAEQASIVSNYPATDRGALWAADVL